MLKILKNPYYELIPLLIWVAYIGPYGQTQPEFPIICPDLC